MSDFRPETLLRLIHKPKWIKEALLLHKGAKKFVNYKRDLLEPDRIAEIESRRADLLAAIRKRDKEAVAESSKQLHNTCEKSLRHYQAPDWLAENLEVFWVAIVVALGIRAYFLQPFRIPTGSMQPTLNGIIAVSHPDPAWEKPWFGKQVIDYALKGRRYYDIVADKDLEVAGIEDSTFFLFSRTKIHFTDGSSVTIPAPTGEALGIDTIRDKVKLYREGRRIRAEGSFQKGDLIFRGTMTSGDLVLVDKFSYHFRRPVRSEPFVFTTKGIKQIEAEAKMNDQTAGSHYIKRLAGLPGDTLQIDEPALYVNGQKASDKGFQKVMEQRVVSETERYTGYLNAGELRSPADKLTLRAEGDPNFHEYAALGDNSANSADSRYWGTVKQHNLVGPALFSLWPFTSGHWGFIK
ncbi:MAG: signal peptidase I [Verrucomicrobiales bacterium]